VQVGNGDRWGQIPVPVQLSIAERSCEMTVCSTQHNGGVARLVSTRGSLNNGLTVVTRNQTERAVIGNK